eukprot:5685824-Pleurochrysis_carterae.AAC.4
MLSKLRSSESFNGPLPTQSQLQIIESHHNCKLAIGHIGSVVVIQLVWKRRNGAHNWLQIPV